MKKKSSRIAILGMLLSSASMVMFACSQRNIPAESRVYEEPFQNDPAKPDSTLAESDYYRSDYIRYDDRIYTENIKTVLLYREGWELSSPILTLGTDDKLVLKFDDLEGDVKNFKYTLIHCDAGWRPSSLTPQEYLDGYPEEDIINHQFSFNTLQKYTHYTLEFPTATLKPRLSGNYILCVYPEGTPQSPVITRKLMIVEPLLSVKASVNRATAIEYRNYKQEIDFLIDKSGYAIANPYRDLQVVIMQNGRSDNSIRDLKPLYVKGDILDYNYEEGNVFSGGNEFRRFDIKSLRFLSEKLLDIYSDSAGFHVLLQPEERNTYKVYQSEKDINGRLLIKSDDNISESSIEAEYVYVHFSLGYDAPLAEGSIYILGALTGWQFSDEGRMKYNYRKKAYEAVMYLKQGYYNYQYVFLPNGSNTGDETLVEGMHYETENDYSLLVYCRDEGSLYDRLIAIEQLNSYGQGNK